MMVKKQLVMLIFIIKNIQKKRKKEIMWKAYLR
jgi:hypothetical protein